MFSSEKNKKVVLGEGCMMVFNLKDRSGTFFDEKGVRIKMLDDDKFYIPSFVSNESQYVDLAIVIGKTHGLDVDFKEKRGDKMKFLFNNP